MLAEAPGLIDDVERPQLAPVSRDNMQDRVYHAIRDSIMAGHIKPDGSITIRSIASAVGTSPMPVREALRRLVAEGALMLLPNRQLKVPPMSVERFNQLAKIRTVLEGLAVAEAAAKITPAVIDRLEKLDQEMRRKRKPADYFVLNREFHFLIYQTAEMNELRSIVESLWLRVGPFFNLLTSDKHCKDFPDTHRALIDALKARDATAARKWIAEDISTFAAMISVSVARDSGLAVSAAERSVPGWMR